MRDRGESGRTGSRSWPGIRSSSMSTRFPVDVQRRFQDYVTGLIASPPPAKGGRPELSKLEMSGADAKIRISFRGAGARRSGRISARFPSLGCGGRASRSRGPCSSTGSRLSSDGRRELRDLGEALQFCHPQSKSFEFLPYDAGRAAPRSSPRGPTAGFGGWMPSRHRGSTAQPTYGMLPARVRVARSLGRGLST